MEEHQVLGSSGCSTDYVALWLLEVGPLLMAGTIGGNDTGKRTR